MKKRNITIAFISALLFNLTLFAQDSLNVTKVGEIYDYWHYATDLCKKDDFVYVATNTTGVRIIDISNPDEPVEIGKLSGCDAADEVKVKGEYLYVLDKYNDTGFQIFDITNPAEPAPAGIFSDNTDFDSFTLDPDTTFAYISYVTGDFVVLDVTDPANLSVVGINNIGRMEVMDIQDDIIYGLYNGLRVIDVSNPQFPVQISYLESGLNDYDVCVDGDYVYAAKGPDDLEIVDISDPTAPFIASGYSGVFTSARAVDVDNERAYILDSDNGLIILDVSDPTYPYYLGGFSNTGGGGGIVVSGDTAYAACYYGGFRILNAAIPSNVSEIGAIDPDLIKALAVSPQYLYAFGEDEGLKVVDIMNPTIPIEVAAIPEPTDVKEARIDGDFLYSVGDGSGFSIIDVSDPLNPSVVYNYALEGFNNRLMVDEDYAYVLATEAPFDRLIVFQITDPLSVTILFDEIFTDYCLDVGFKEEIFYLLADCYLKIFDFTNWILTPLDSIQHCICTTDIEIEGDIMMLGSFHNIYIYDISDPVNPEFESDVDLYDGAWGMFLLNSHIYFGRGIEAGFNVLDAADINNVTTAGYYNIPSGWSGGICAQDVYCYYSNNFSIQIFDCSEALSVEKVEEKSQPMTFALYPPYPNPFNPSTSISFDLPSSGYVNLTVYDITGREVQSLVDGHLSLGKHQVTLDGSNWTSGIYFVRLTAGPNTQTLKILLLK